MDNKSQKPQETYISRLSYVHWAAIFLACAVVLAVLFIGLSSSGAPAVNTNSANSSDNVYTKRTNWSPVQRTNANVSHFIYRDINRNGIYDVGDRPIVGIAVKLIRPDKTSVIRRSNIHGFVNITNSMTESPVDVSETGKYSFEVLVPDGWVLTSDNAVQVANYKEQSTTRPGIIADNVPVPAGLAQALTIKGRVAVRTESGALVAANPDNVLVSGISPSGSKLKIPIDKLGRFSISGEPGQWLIRATFLGNIYERVVVVDEAPVQMSTIILGDGAVKPKQSVQLVKFEDVTQSIITKVPVGVAGLNWMNLIVVDNEMYGGEGYINNTMSGKYVAYNTSGYPVTIAHKDGFDFHGAYFGVAWLEAEGEILEVRAWRNDQLVAEEEYELSALGPFWFDADYYNITRLELSTRHYWQFVMDDISVGLND